MIPFKTFLNICLLKAGPADVPVSAWLMRLCLIAYFGVGAAVSHVDHGLRISLFASLADTGLLLAVCWFVLQSRRHGARFTQTATAMAATGALMGMLALPVFLLFRQVEPQGQLTSLVLLAVVMVVLWSLAVTAHIFRQALEIGPGMAAIITIGYTIVSLFIVGVTIAGVA